MKIEFKIFIACLLISFNALAQDPIEWNKLYNKNWLIVESKIVKPNKQGQDITLYSRGKTSFMDLDRMQMYFNNSGTGGGVDADGNVYTDSWKFEGNRSIWSEGDRKPAEVVKLTDTDLILQISQLYKSPYSSEEELVIAQDKYISFESCTIYESLRSGNWSDPTIWTCQKIPTVNDKVQINKDHEITVPNNYIANAKIIEQKGKLNLKENAKLILGQ